MFHTLHRIMLVARWALLLCLGVVLYQNRAVLWPVVGVVQALSIREGFEQQAAGELNGTVIKILDGNTFQLRSEGGQVCTIRLTGLDAPDFRPTNKAAILLARQSKTNLSRLILSNDVRVEITYSNHPHGALGIVYLGRTNINAAIVASGTAKLKREYMNGLPFREKYALLEAAKKASDREKSATE